LGGDSAAESLAYAGIAGVPAVYGLYTVPLAMVGYAIFGTSRTLSVGPDSATVVLSAVTVGALAGPGIGAQRGLDWLTVEYGIY
jgi:MFS superfamily sulfate permease-like transporter